MPSQLAQEGEAGLRHDTAAPHRPEQQLLQDLHTLLIETEIISGHLTCGNCGHEYKIKGGVANFLLPSHLSKSLAN